MLNGTLARQAHPEPVEGFLSNGPSSSKANGISCTQSQAPRAESGTRSACFGIVSKVTTAFTWMTLAVGLSRFGLLPRPGRCRPPGPPGTGRRSRCALCVVVELSLGLHPFEGLVDPIREPRSGYACVFAADPARVDVHRAGVGPDRLVEAVSAARTEPGGDPAVRLDRHRDAHVAMSRSVREFAGGENLSRSRQFPPGVHRNVSPSSRGR